MEQFESQLALLNAKNPTDVEEEERAQFVAAYTHLLPPEQIRARISVPPPPPSSPATTSSTVPDAGAWESIVSSIADRLQIVQMRSLYELLQKPTSASTGELKQEASALYGRLVRQTPSAEATVKMELTGLARSVFKNDETRARYDTLLREAGLRTVLQQLDESMSRAKRQEIHVGQVRVFLHEAKKHGWAESDALEQLQAYAAQKQWAMMSMEKAQPQPPTVRENDHEVMAASAQKATSGTEEASAPEAQRGAAEPRATAPTKRTTTSPLPTTPTDSAKEFKEFKDSKNLKNLKNLKSAESSKSLLRHHKQPPVRRCSRSVPRPPPSHCWARRLPPPITVNPRLPPLPPAKKEARTKLLLPHGISHMPSQHHQNVSQTPP